MHDRGIPIINPRILASHLFNKSTVKINVNKNLNNIKHCQPILNSPSIAMKICWVAAIKNRKSDNA